MTLIHPRPHSDEPAMAPGPDDDVATDCTDSRSAEHGDRRPPPANVALLALVVFACAIGVAVVGVSMTDPREGPGPGSSASDARTPSGPRVAEVRAGAHVTFRSTALGPAYGEVGLTPTSTGAAAPASAPATTGLDCERFAEGGDRGLCLIADRGAITTYRAVVVDRDYRELSSFDLPGTPSRARVSPDGRHGALTVFVTGHSYAQVGFSTYTQILDLQAGTSLGDLEQFEMWHDGAPLDAVDRNFWGVTFTGDGNTFYATASTGGSTHLVLGDLRNRSMTTLRPDVECPSLSPDGTRIAFKQRATGALGQVTWRLAVLDLATGSITPTAETASVDDQAEWLDDETILYGLPAQDEGTPVTDVWAVPADGSGAPSVFLPGAWSPTVPIRP